MKVQVERDRRRRFALREIEDGRGGEKERGFDTGVVRGRRRRSGSGLGRGLATVQSDRAPAGVQSVVGSERAQSSGGDVRAGLVDDGNGNTARAISQEPSTDAQKDKHSRLVHPPALAAHLDTHNIFDARLHTHLVDLARGGQLGRSVPIVAVRHSEAKRE